MSVKYYINKYLDTKKKSFRSSTKPKFDPTIKFVEYSCDIILLNQHLNSTNDILLKYDLVKALEVAERKKRWHQNKDDFDNRRAAFLISAFKNAEKYI